MKKLFYLFFILIAVLFQGCIVKSLQPFYKADDVVFRKELVNSWVDDDENKWVIKPIKEEPNAYELTYTIDGKSALFRAHLFTLNQELYVDFFPITNESETPIFDLHLLPTHSVAKVELLSEDEVRIKWFNEKWLRTLFAQNRIRIAHETITGEDDTKDEDKIYVLTASTEELQKFIMKYGHEDAQFDDYNTVRLNLKRSL